MNTFAKFIGIPVFIVGLILGGYLLQKQSRAYDSAHDLDSRWSVYSFTSCYPNIEVNIPNRVMSAKESQVIVAKLSTISEEKCKVTASIAAPAFEISPEKEGRSAIIASDSSATIPWVLLPEKTGSHELTISSGNKFITRGVSVTTVLGLSPFQAKVLSLTSTFLGFVLTLPWLIKLYNKYKK